MTKIDRGKKNRQTRWIAGAWLLPAMLVTWGIGCGGSDDFGGPPPDQDASSPGSDAGFHDAAGDTYIPPEGDGGSHDDGGDGGSHDDGGDGGSHDDGGPSDGDGGH